MGLTQNLGRLSPSIFSDSSLNIGVGAAPSGTYKFEVTGTSKVSGVLTLGATLSNGTYAYTLPSATGTLALTSQIPSLTGYVPYTGATATLNMGINDIKGAGLQLKDGTSFTPTTGYTTLSSNASVSGILAITFDNSVGGASLQFTRNVFNTYTFPNATGTIALVGGSGVGTVTSVAALTLGTSGTDLSSTVANSTTTPVITLNVPTASATNRGALSAADWSTFNSKQGTITLTTTGTSGAATFSANTLNIPQYQGVLTNPVTGTGTGGYIPKWTSGSVIANSVIQDDGTNIGVGNVADSNGRLTLWSDGSFAQQFINTGAGGTTWQIGPTNTNYGAGGGKFVFTYGAASLNSILTLVQASGNVGIGNVNPSQKLEVAGIIRGESLNVYGTSNPSSTSPYIYSPNGNDFGFGCNGVTRFTISSTGAATFSNSVTSSFNGFNALGAYGITSYEGASPSGKNIQFTLAIFNSIDGIYQSSGNTNDFGIWTNGGTLSQPKLYIKNGGNVGIGTVSPDERLTVGAGNGISIRTVNSGTYGALKFGTNNATYAAAWAGIDSDWEGQGINVSNLRFYTSFGAIAEAMRITSGGNVLIGTTTNSGYKLEVNGTFKATGNLNYNTGYAIYPRTTAVGDWFLCKHNASLDRIENALGTNNPFTLGNFTSGYTANIFLYGGGNATFNGAVTATGGLISSSITMGGNGDIISASSNSGFLTIGSTQPIRFTDTGSNEWARFTNTGKFLIGTTTDDTVNKLQVNGSGVFTSNLKVTGKTFTTTAQVSVPNAIATTVYTMASGQGIGMLTISPASGGTTNAAYTAICTIGTIDTNYNLLNATLGTANITITRSGANIQVTHAIGSSTTFNVTYLSLQN